MTYHTINGSSYEVFHVSPNQVASFAADDCGVTEAGWYWWSCSPGCMPDGDAFGPFASEELAIEDAKGDTEADEQPDAVFYLSGPDDPEAWADAEEGWYWGKTDGDSAGPFATQAEAEAEGEASKDVG